MGLTDNVKCIYCNKYFKNLMARNVHAGHKHKQQIHDEMEAFRIWKNMMEQLPEECLKNKLNNCVECGKYDECLNKLISNIEKWGK